MKAAVWQTLVTPLSHVPHCQRASVCCQTVASKTLKLLSGKFQGTIGHRRRPSLCIVSSWTAVRQSVEH